MAGPDYTVTATTDDENDISHKLLFTRKRGCNVVYVSEITLLHPRAM